MRYSIVLCNLTTKMRKLNVLILFCFVINSCATRGQEIDFNDTIFFIVDKNADYIEYTETPNSKNFKIIVNCKWADTHYPSYVPMGFHYFEYGTNDNKIKSKINSECCIVCSKYFCFFRNFLSKIKKIIIVMLAM